MLVVVHVANVGRGCDLCHLVIVFHFTHGGGVAPVVAVVCVARLGSKENELEGCENGNSFVR
jgi:hypothetical protein